MDKNYLLIQEYYSRSREQLIHYALKCQLELKDAEDIVQDTFLRFLVSDKMINKVTLPALTHSVLCNLIRDRWRHQVYVDQHERYIKYSSSRSEDGMRLISMHETEIWIQKSIAKLDEKNCKIYRMSMEEGKKVSEIADCLHIK